MLEKKNRQNQALIILVTLACCAFFIAEGTTNIFAMSALSIRPVDNKGSYHKENKTEAVMPPGSQNPDPKKILKRNIFDSNTGPLWPPPTNQNDLLQQNANAEKEAQSPPSPYDPPEECQNQIFLVASVYYPENPSRSFLVLDGKEVADAQQLFRQGMEVGEHELTTILPSAAYLREPAGTYCSLKLFSDRKPKKVSKKKTKSKRSKRKAKRKNKKRRQRKRASKQLVKEIKEGVQKLAAENTLRCISNIRNTCNHKV